MAPRSYHAICPEHMIAPRLPATALGCSRARERSPKCRALAARIRPPVRARSLRAIARSLRGSGTSGAFVEVFRRCDPLFRQVPRACARCRTGPRWSSDLALALMLIALPLSSQCLSSDRVVHDPLRVEQGIVRHRANVREPVRRHVVLAARGSPVARRARRRVVERRCTTNVRARSGAVSNDRNARAKGGNRFEHAPAHVISSQHQGLPSIVHAPVSTDTKIPTRRQIRSSSLK